MVGDSLRAPAAGARAEDRSGRAGASAGLALLAGTAAQARPWTSRLPDTRVPTQGRAGEGAALSTPEVSANRDRVDTLSGLMSAAAIFLAFLCATDLHLTIAGTDVQMRPVRVGVAAVVLALIAAGVGGRHRKLAAAATAIAGAGWLLGMIVAVITERPLF